MTSIVSILMERDDMSRGEAEDLVQQARLAVLNGEDPEEILLEEFGLEPDYLFDILCPFEVVP